MQHRSIVLDMGKKSIKKNYIYNVSYQILTLITPFITAPYIARVLGADGVGTVSYIGSIVSYFTLFASLGISTYGRREISYVQGSLEKRSEVFWNTKILEFTTSLIAIVIFFVFAITRNEPAIYLIYVLSLLSVFTDVTWFFQGMEEFGKIVLRNFVLKFVDIIFIFAVVRSRDDILIYVFGTSFFSLLGGVSLWGYLPGYISKVNISKLHPYKDLLVVISLFIPTIAIQIYTVFDKTMIGIITKDSFENGYYEQALKISKMVLTIVTALGTVMIPRIGYLFQSKEIDQVRQLMYRGYRFVWFLGIPLCLGLMMTAGNFVPWFFGDGYEKVVPLIRLLSLLVIVIGISNVTGLQYLVSTKRQNLLTLSVSVGAGVNFLMNLVLINLFQATGAAIASVIAETAVTVVQIIIVRKELSPLQIIKESRNYLLAGITMACVLLPLSKTLSASAVHTVMMVVCGAAVYFIVLLVLRDEFFIMNVRVVFNKYCGILKR